MLTLSLFHISNRESNPTEDFPFSTLDNIPFDIPTEAARSDCRIPRFFLKCRMLDPMLLFTTVQKY
jgi:hypothetical protein